MTGVWETLALWLLVYVFRPKSSFSGEPNYSRSCQTLTYTQNKYHTHICTQSKRTQSFRYHARVHTRRPFSLFLLMCLVDICISQCGSFKHRVCTLSVCTVCVGGQQWFVSQVAQQRIMVGKNKRQMRGGDRKWKGNERP